MGTPAGRRGHSVKERGEDLPLSDLHLLLIDLNYPVSPRDRLTFILDRLEFPCDRLLRLEARRKAEQELPMNSKVKPHKVKQKQHSEYKSKQSILYLRRGEVMEPKKRAWVFIL
jgi:hypothetical protein